MIGDAEENVYIESPCPRFSRVSRDSFLAHCSWRLRSSSYCKTAPSFVSFLSLLSPEKGAGATGEQWVSGRREMQARFSVRERVLNATGLCQFYCYYYFFFLHVWLRGGFGGGEGGEKRVRKRLILPLYNAGHSLCLAWSKPALLAKMTPSFQLFFVLY